MIKKNKILILAAVLLVIGVVLLVPKIGFYLKWKKEIAAAGSYPYVIGLTGVTVFPCVPAALGACPGTLCPLAGPGRCGLYSEVMGTPAGGTGSNALFLKSSLSMAGVMPGGSLIAGGMGPTLMDSGVLAGPGGCIGSGCLAMSNSSRFAFFKEMVETIKFFMAGGRE